MEKEQRPFQVGDICVWMGIDEAIVRIKTLPEDSKVNQALASCENCYEAEYISEDDNYNSLHESNLRAATEEEQDWLGDKVIMKLKYDKKLSKYIPKTQYGS